MAVYLSPVLQIGVRAGGRSYRIDLGYPQLRLGIEADGRGVHESPEAVLADRWRQNALRNAKWSLLRFTWSDVIHRPWYVVDTVREALAERGAA
jgi:very-short-patch-repair endonuclease